jgi:hypothetical protein
MIKFLTYLYSKFASFLLIREAFCFNNPDYRLV